MMDVVVIGAGMAGLTCARRLQQQGYQVSVLEKSRGLGGRVATRRVDGAWIDHGVRCLADQGTATRSHLNQLLADQTIMPWPCAIAELTASGDIKSISRNDAARYVSPVGLTAVAKAMAKDLTIHRQRRVIRLAVSDSTAEIAEIAEIGNGSVGNGNCDRAWKITAQSSDGELTDLARLIVLAIPAPQAVPLLQPLLEQGLSAAWLSKIQAVEFEPCFSVMAGYATDHPVQALQQQWQVLRSHTHPDLAWVSWENSKYQQSANPVLLLQSTADFARRYLEAADLTPVGERLLAQLSNVTGIAMTQPDWLQVHRWRYGFVRQAWDVGASGLTDPLPLVCCGDWCGKGRVEDALQSGQMAAEWALSVLTAM